MCYSLYKNVFWEAYLNFFKLPFFLGVYIYCGMFIFSTLFHRVEYEDFFNGVEIAYKRLAQNVKKRY